MSAGLPPARACLAGPEREQAAVPRRRHQSDEQRAVGVERLGARLNAALRRGKDADGAPSFRYISLLRDGARAHGLPESWVQFLDSVKHVE